VGEASIEDERKQITLDICDRKLVLPVADTLVIGRRSAVPGETGPDIDLNPFSAHEMGVSRRHVRISRVNNWPYVTDLGSSNGTFLNGRALVPNAQRVLRNGDELQLGRLKVRVKF